MNRKLIPVATLLAAFAASATAQAEVEIFRGSIVDATIEMKLNINGQELSGTYTYDAVGKDLTVKGTRDTQGKILLKEYDKTEKQTGSFEGQSNTKEDGTTSINGIWKPAVGGKEADFYLEEESPAEFSKGWRIAPKLITNKALGIAVAYPQIVGGTSPAIEAFNARVAALVTKDVNDYKSESSHGSYDSGYRVLLATDDFISVLIEAGLYEGGAYPDTLHRAVTFDLKSGREVKLAELFKDPAHFEKALFDIAFKKVQERLPKEEWPFLASEREKGVILASWGMTRKGIQLAFNFPHAIDAVSAVFVPYTELENLLNPKGPASSARTSLKSSAPN